MIEFNKYRVINYIEKHRIGYYNFSKLCGINYKTMVRILYEDYNCRYLTIRKIAHAMNIKPVELIRDKRTWF